MNDIFQYAAVLAALYVGAAIVLHLSKIRAALEMIVMFYGMQGSGGEKLQKILQGAAADALKDYQDMEMPDVED